MLVAQLVAANPTYPTTLYLQFRLKFMQGEIDAAAQLVSRLRNLNLTPGALPLTEHDLAVLPGQLDYWKPLLCLPSTKLQTQVEILTGSVSEELHPAPLSRCPAGDAYQVENGGLLQFRATNPSSKPMYLYYVAIVPTGRLVIGPLLDPVNVDVQGLEPHTSGHGHSLMVKGLPGSVTETRIFCSPEMIWQLFAPPTGAARLPALDSSVLNKVQMQAIWYQIRDDGMAGPADTQTILSAFVW